MTSMAIAPAPFVATTNKQIAQTIALNDYLSEWEGDPADVFGAQKCPDYVSVWRPFEDWEWSDVLSNIEDLADRVEEALNTASDK